MEAKVPVPNMLKRDNNSKIGGGGGDKEGGKQNGDILMYIAAKTVMAHLFIFISSTNQPKHTHIYINISQFAILVKR